MQLNSRRLHQVLRSTAAIVISSLVLSPAAFAAFDPNAGAGGQTSALPDTSILYDGAPRQPAQRPLYPALVNSPGPARPLYAPAPAAAISTPPIVVPAYTPVTPASPVEAAVPMTVSAPAEDRTIQPVTSISTNVAPATAVVSTPGFIAPAPVFAMPPPPPPTSIGSIPPVPAAQPVPAAAPQSTAVMPPLPPADTLSDQTKTILSHIPSRLDTVKPTATRKIALNRVSPEVSSVLGKGAKEAAYESVGLSIKVRRPGLDTNYELNRAYTALMGGDTQTAISIYKNILDTDPRNQDALFGLATTYHRLGEIDKARPFYGMLLRVNPNHRGGLNNFLVLVSDESPQEALAELERLEQRNPDFSPIPAQEAVVLDKLGYFNEAREKMLHAIDLAPDNLTYKYNLAVMLDSHGDYADAAALYRLLVDAALKGQTIPSNLETIQTRLNYITSVAAAAPQGSGS